MSINPNEVYERMRLAGDLWAKLDGAASKLEEQRKSIWAQIMIQQGDVSVAKAEMLAEASKVYTDHIEKMVSARTEANIARAEYDSIKSWIELVRSAEASKRAELTCK